MRIQVFGDLQSKGSGFEASLFQGFRFLALWIMVLKQLEAKASVLCLEEANSCCFPKT